MAARQIIVPGAMPSRDGNGRALPAKLRFYLPATTIPTTVYKTNALVTPHDFPILSDAAGRFPAIWADDANSFDVGWTDQTFDAVIRTFAGVTTASDAVLASVALADGAATAAQLAQTAAETARDAALAAATLAASAAGFLTLIQAADDDAALIAGVPLHGLYRNGSVLQVRMV